VAALIDRWTDEIVTGLVTLVHIFNPSDIILGGGVMARQELVAEIERRLKKSVAPGFDGVRLRAAGLSNFAGLMGAAYLAASFLNKELGKEEET
jgi:predicted NBD/HSP70 family sugar kinase